MDALLASETCDLMDDSDKFKLPAPPSFLRHRRESGNRSLVAVTRNARLL